MAAVKRHMDVPQGACFGKGVPASLYSMFSAPGARPSGSLFDSN